MQLNVAGWQQPQPSPSNSLKGEQLPSNTTVSVWLILRHLRQVAMAIDAGDIKARRVKADIFLKTVQIHNLPDKEYLEVWLADMI